jgi:hypothetical protein
MLGARTNLAKEGRRIQIERKIKEEAEGNRNVDKKEWKM